MERFKGNIICKDLKYYVIIPNEVLDKWDKKVVTVNGSFLYDKKTFLFHRRIIKDNDLFLLPIPKNLVNKLNEDKIIVFIEPISNSFNIKHFEGFDYSFYLDSFSKTIRDETINYHLFDNIYKRKSFHVFNDIEVLSKDDLLMIKDYISKMNPLINDIKTYFKIIPAELSNCSRKEEYVIYIYSEEKPHYLENAGYLGEQLDLFLASKNIGCCWYGIGSTKEKVIDNMHFVIMIAFAKVKDTLFRKDMYKAERLPLMDCFKASNYLDIAGIARFAPSACNSQPWFVDEKLALYRLKKRKGIMPIDRIYYFNRIDIGIYLLFLDIISYHFNYKMKMNFYIEDTSDKELICDLSFLKTISKD